MKITNTDKFSIFILSALFASCALVIFTYYPGLSGPFILDDINNLYELNKFGGVTDYNSFMQFVFGNSSGNLGRPVSMLSFLLDDQYYPGDPAKYKYTNVLIHVLCGLLIFHFIWKLLLVAGKDNRQSAAIALIVSIIWLLHPFNVSTVLYIIQRMAQLATLFTIAGLICYLYGREIAARNERLGLLIMTLSLFPFGVLATLSKENGILILGFILLLEFTVFNNSAKSRLLKLWLGICVVFPIILFIGWIISTWDGQMRTYTHRDFTLYERLLTEARVLCQYIFKTVLPSSVGTGVFHDDYPISRSLLSPATTLPAILSIIVLLVVAVKSRKTAPLLALAILWYFIGHLLESTFFPLEIYFEHRNYLPMVGVILGSVLVLKFLLDNYINKASTRKLIYAVVPAIIVVYSTLVTYQSSTIWGNTLKFYSVAAYEHPDSLRAQSVFGRFLAKIGEHEKAITVLKRIYSIHNEDISLALTIFNTSCRRKLPQPYTFDEIIQASKHAKYTGQFSSIVLNFIETNLSPGCYGYTHQQLHQVLDALEKITWLPKTALAEMQTVRAEIYVKDRDLNNAMLTLDRAFANQQLPVIAIRQVQLLVSAGLYDVAIEFLNKAKQAEKLNRLVLPEETFKYDVIEKDILSLKSQSQNAGSAGADKPH